MIKTLRQIKRLERTSRFRRIGLRSSCDNALAESVIGLFKTEAVNALGPWRTLRDVEWQALKWIDWRNNRRLLAPIGYIPPAEAENAYFANLKTLDQAA